MLRKQTSVQISRTRKAPQRQTDNGPKQAAPKLEDIKTWTERLGRTKLRTFTGKDGRFWLEQNTGKASKWAKLARQGHEIAWEFDKPGGTYTGLMLIDGEIMTPSEAAKKFLQSQ
jgi:hypothetical protein